MELSEGRKMHSQMLAELKRVLIDCGVPEDAIATEVVLRLQRGDRRDADLLILGEDGKTIVAQFEVRVGPDPYNMARKILRDLPQRHKCYVVTNIEGKNVISAIDNSRLVNWVNLSDSVSVKQLIGDYLFESVRVVDKMNERSREAESKELGCFRWVIGAVGLLLVIIAGCFEWNGHEFSWKVYFLLFVVIALFAAASGYIVHIKAGDNEIAIEKK